MPPTIDVQAVMEQIRERARLCEARERSHGMPERQLPGMADLENAARALRALQSLVGEVPPVPPRFAGIWERWPYGSCGAR